MVLLHRGGRARDVPGDVPATPKTPLIKRGFRSVGCRISKYSIEIAMAVIVYVVVTQILAVMEVVADDVFTHYETILVMLVMVVLLIGVIVMFNTARTRASAAEILSHLQGSNDTKQ